MEKLSILILFTCYHSLYGNIFACDNQPKDIVFILDSSGSIDEVNYGYSKVATIKLMNALKENGRLAFEQFGSDAKILFNIDSKATFEEKMKIVLDAKHTGGVTAIGKSLKVATEQIQPKMNRNSIRIIFLITDGQNNKWPAPHIYADQLKNDGVKIVCIGVGNSVSKIELERIASENAVIMKSNYETLKNEFQQILDQTCFQTHPIPNPCVVLQQDIVFLLDSSSSLSNEDFKNSKNFVKTFINMTEVGTNKTRVAMISFSKQSRLDFNIDTYSDKTGYLRGINKAVKFGGLTSIGSALYLTLETVFPKRRSDVPFNIIIVTDGMNTISPWPKIPSQKLKTVGAFIITVAVGADVDFNELKEISSNGKIITVVNFAELVKSVKSIEKIVTCG